MSLYPQGVNFTSFHETTADVKEAVTYIRSLTKFKPTLALILGSGLGDFGEKIFSECTINTKEIPHYPISSVSGHAGKLIFGYLQQYSTRSLPLLVFQGRVHFYETEDLQKVIFSLLVAKELGIKKVLITNAAGGINKNFRAGDLMLITDVLNLAFLSTAFQNAVPKNTPSKSLFDRMLQDTIVSNAQKLGLPLKQGTYCWLKGPSYETPAEVQMLQKIGADAVGMSTVPEIYMAHQLGLRVAGISLISNLAAGISASKLTHKEVTDTAEKVKSSFTHLMEQIIFSIQ